MFIMDIQKAEYEENRILATKYVIDVLQRQRIDMKETARQMLIAKAFKAFREVNHAFMEATVKAELSLVTGMKRASDRIIGVCPSSTSYVIVERLRVYFKGQGIDLQSGEYATFKKRKVKRELLGNYDKNDERETVKKFGYYVNVPRAYDVAEMRKKINAILANRDW